MTRLVTLVAFGSGERRVIDEESHRQRRRIDRLRLQRLDDFRGAQRVGDVEFFKAGDGDDVASFGLVDRGALNARKARILDTRPCSRTLP